MVEIATPPCKTILELEQTLSRLALQVEDLASHHGATLYAASLHPFSSHRHRKLSPGKRYLEIMGELQLVGRRMMTQALHVHVGLPTREALLQVFNPVRELLPILLALTTSSPFFEGEDTGFASYRTSLFKALPRSGIPETLPHWSHFEQLVTLLAQGTSLASIKELWWDVRPHPDFGTIEFRICDLPGRFREIVGMAALIQALVKTLAEEPHPTPRYREVILNNKWHASRYGLDSTFVAQRSGEHLPMREAAARLLEKVKPAASALGSEGFLNPVFEVLESGTSAHRQRRLFEESGDFAVMIRRLQEEFWQ